MKQPVEFALQDLATPFEQPGALPDGISASLGVIATTPPSELSTALHAADPVHRDRLHSERIALGATYEKNIELLQRIRDSRRGTLDAVAETAGLQSRRGQAPTPETLDELYVGLPKQIAETEEEIAIRGPEADEAMLLAERVRMAREAAALETQTKLFETVSGDVKRLSGVGRMVTTVAGMVPGVGITTAEVVSHSDQGSTLVTMGMGGVVVAAGAYFGHKIGERFKGHFAQRNAKKIVAKAHLA
jgi:hypothetical protein